jgi:hypothetical protein
MKRTKNKKDRGFADKRMELKNECIIILVIIQWKWPGIQKLALNYNVFSL